MSQLQLLLRNAYHQALRRPALGKSKNATLAAGLLGLGFLVLVGLAILPESMPRGSQENPGGTVLELAFWLTCLLSAVQSFRTMEALFRTGDARIVAPLPLNTQTLFLYRLIRGLAEVALLSLAGAALLLPIVWRGDPGLYGACLAVWAGGLAITLCVSFGVTLYAGVASIQGEAQFDMHGPSGFILAPGLSLLVSVLLILFAKLTAEEFLNAGFAKPARTGLMIVGIPSLISLIIAWRYFVNHFYAIFATFLEADLFVLDIGHPYFQEGRKPKTFVERSLPDAIVPLFRKDRLQYRRRHTLSRILVWLAAIGLAGMMLARGADALPPPLLIILPLLIVQLFANPWGHLAGHDLEPGMGDALPTRPADRARSKRAVALLEVLALSAPLTIAIILGVGYDHRGWLYGLATGIVAFALTVCAHPLLAFLAERGAGFRVHLGTALVLAAASGVSTFSIFIVLPLAGIILAAGKLLPTPTSSQPASETPSSEEPATPEETPPAGQDPSQDQGEA